MQLWKVDHAAVLLLLLWCAVLLQMLLL